MESTDAGHIQVLEAILVTLVLMGAAYTVVSFRLPSSETGRARSAFDKIAQDALTVLAGLADDRGSLLAAGLGDAIHCVQDPAAQAPLCTGNASANLSFRLSNYLPAGAGYALLLDNGVAARELYRSPLPATEIVTSGLNMVPDWNLTFAMPELSCYEPGMDVNVSMIAVRHGAVTNLSMLWVNASAGGPWNATRSTATADWWNATLPAATRPASSNITVNATGKRGTFPGESSYASCGLNGQGNRTRDALRNSTLTLANANNTTAVGATASFSVDLTPLATATNVTLLSSTLTVYEPLAPRPNEPDAYAPAVTLPLGSGKTPQANWLVPFSSIYGVHPVVVRALVNVTMPSGPAVGVEARLVGTLTIALPSGTVPVEAPYRAVLQAWLPDWR